MVRYVVLDNQKVKDIRDDKIIEGIDYIVDEMNSLYATVYFCGRVMKFFADSPLTKYSSTDELYEEMKEMFQMGLV